MKMRPAAISWAGESHAHARGAFADDGFEQANLVLVEQWLSA